MKTILIITKKQSKQFSAPIGTTIEFKKDRTIYNYLSGKKYVKYKTKSQTFGKAYDWRMDG